MARHGGHGHHHHIPPGAGDRRILLAIAINFSLTLVQVAAGIVSGSLAMIADAVHNLSDAFSLLLAYLARRIARRPAHPRMSFGYGRVEIVAAFANYVTLIVIAIYLLWEGVARLIAPQPVEGWIVVVVAGFALAVDAATAAMTYAMSKDSVNVRAAFLHNLADALGSVAVMVAGTLILLFGWWIVDPLVTLGISAYILWHAGREIVPVARMLMLGAPPGLDPAEVGAAMAEVEGVAGVHHLHLWQIDERRNSLEAHVVREAGAGAGLRARLGEMLKDRFGIGHATLQIETGDDRCPDAGSAQAAGSGK